MKLLKILLEQEKILVPRRIRDREKNLARATQQKIQQYIKDGSKGNLDLKGTPITSLPDNLKYVRGSLYLSYTGITSLPDNLKVEKDIFLQNTPITSLPNNLKHVTGTLNLIDSSIASLPDDLKVDGHLLIQGSAIDSLPKNLYVIGVFDIRKTPLAEKYSNSEIKKAAYIRSGIYR